jgi:enoyl-[acyl-carrier-protein] reductase (NADH)
VSQVGREFETIDFLVHSVAFAPREELTGEFVATSRQGFATALDISAYSLVALSRVVHAVDGGGWFDTNFDLSWSRAGSCPITT